MENGQSTAALSINDRQNGQFIGSFSVFISDSWTGDPPAEVVVTLRDRDLTLDPMDRGSTRDPLIILQWKINKFGGTCPDSLTQIGGPDASDFIDFTDEFLNDKPVVFYYEAEPVHTPPRPNYEGLVFNEEFDSAFAVGYIMDDLNQNWLDDHTDLVTENRVAEFLFGNLSNNLAAFGAFYFDEQDRVGDGYSGFSKDPAEFYAAFKKSAFYDSDGVGFTLIQRYRCGEEVFRTVALSRRYREENVTNENGEEEEKVIFEMKKVGPY